MARARMGMVHDMAIKLLPPFRRRYDCYNGLHNMRPEKVWKTDNWFFMQAKCKRCGVRKVTRTPLGD